MTDSLGRQHAILLLKYSGISFISGAVNHGFFSGERSLWTAATGMLLFVLGAGWEHRRSGDETGVLGTLLWGALLSIGLGFFTGGLQHFPDSPARSAWVVPLGFLLSALALVAQSGRMPARRTLASTAALGVAVLAGSLGALQYLSQQPLLAHADHDHGTVATQAATRIVVVRMLDTMRFEPAVVRVQRGETVRFVASNEGQVAHELVVGTVQDIQEHAASMAAGQGHAHAGGIAVTVQPGQAGEFVATFDRDQVLEMACLVPGHYEAGMRGRVDVAALEPAVQPQAAHPGHKH